MASRQKQEPTQKDYQKAQIQIKKMFDRYINHLKNQTKNLRPNREGIRLVGSKHLIVSKTEFGGGVQHKGFNNWFLTNIAYINQQLGIDNSHIQSIGAEIKNRYTENISVASEAERGSQEMTAFLKTSITPEKVLEPLLIIVKTLFDKLEETLTPIKDDHNMFDYEDFMKMLEPELGYYATTPNKIFACVEMIENIARTHLQNDNNLKNKQDFQSIMKATECLKPMYALLYGYAKQTKAEELRHPLESENAKPALELFTHKFDSSNYSISTRLVFEDTHRRRRSQLEYGLKIASIVSILAGVGFITTGLLVAKRLYDTGGTSINFFKPLSQNLHEDTKDALQKHKIPTSKK